MKPFNSILTEASGLGGFKKKINDSVSTYIYLDDGSKDSPTELTVGLKWGVKLVATDSYADADAAASYYKGEMLRFTRSILIPAMQRNGSKTGLYTAGYDGHHTGDYGHGGGGSNIILDFPTRMTAKAGEPDFRFNVLLQKMGKKGLFINVPVECKVNKPIDEWLDHFTDIFRKIINLNSHLFIGGKYLGKKLPWVAVASTAGSHGTGG